VVARLPIIVALTLTVLIGQSTAVRPDRLSATAFDRPIGTDDHDHPCHGGSLGATDDGWAGPVRLPFVVNFFGTAYRSVYVNANGTVSFRAPLTAFTPFQLTTSAQPVIAPFFADVDTRGAGTITYGTTVVDGRPAFCVAWDHVGYFNRHIDKLNTFELILVAHGQLGDFDIMLIYTSLTWEAGDASGGVHGFGGTPAGAGFTAGDGVPNHLLRFPGSQTPLGLLDLTGATGLVRNSRGTLQLGHYVFRVRNGVARSSPQA
jgi:nidogen-like